MRQKKEYPTNVFNYGYGSGFRRIKLFFYRLKWAWQRATRGYCDSDLYDLYSYYAGLMINSLNEFAEKTPGGPWGLSKEEWKTSIKEIATLLAESEEERDFECPEYKIWKEVSEKHKTTPEAEEARENWVAACKKEYSRRETAKNKAFDLLKKHFWHLWW